MPVVRCLPAERKTRGVPSAQPCRVFLLLLMHYGHRAWVAGYGIPDQHMQ